MSRDLHVVFGAGQVGGVLAARLVERGYRVRVVKRSAGGVPEGLETVLGDAADPDFCARVAGGAAVLYHCMNPPYSTKVWARLVPLYMDNLIAAATRFGARLVVLDNLYMMGRTGGRPMNEDTPIAPVSAKGAIRADAEARLFEAYRHGSIQAVVARASDFYGPGGAAGTHFGEPFWKPVFAGKRARLLINPDRIHTYHYIPDVAHGLSLLGAAPDEDLGIAWMLPAAPAEPARRLVERFSKALGREIRIAAMPRTMVRLTGLFVPIVKEIDEMLYQWEEPFIVDDSRFRTRFGMLPTDPDEGARRTVEWARRTWSR